MRRRGHDDRIALPGRPDAPFGAAPRHDGGRRRNAAVENLVPADQAPAVRLQEAFDALRGVALQLPRRGQPLGAHARPAVRTLLPHFGRALVAADMNIGRGEEPDYLVEHPLDEVERRIAPDAEDPVVDVPRLAHLVPFARAAQPRIGGQRRHGVARELDLGNDRDEAPRGIVDHFAHLLLCIEAAVGALVVTARLVVLAAGVLADERAPPHRSDARQLGVAADFDAPALIVGQVPVKDIHLVQRQQIERALDLVDRKEVARHVEHQPAVGHRGPVLDLHRGQFDRPHAAVEGLHGQQLPQRLHGIEGPFGSPGPNIHPLRRHRQTVGIGRHRGIQEEIHRMRLTGLRKTAFESAPENRLQHLVERVGHPAHPLVGGFDTNRGRGPEAEHPLNRGNAHRNGNHVDRPVRGKRPAACTRGCQQPRGHPDTNSPHTPSPIRRPKRPAVRHVRCASSRYAGSRPFWRRGTPEGARTSPRGRSRRRGRCCRRRRSPVDRKRRAPA